MDGRCEIFLLGKPTFQNTALSNLLDRSTRHDCRVVELIPTALSGRRALLLVDVHERDLLEVLRWLESVGGLTDKAQVALLNVPPAGCPVEVIGFPFLKGVFPAAIDSDQLIRGIDSIFRGEPWFPRYLLLEHLETTRRVHARPFSALPLTVKEIEILTCVAAGATNTDIAEQLSISVHTVKTHVYNLFRKIKVSNRTQATVWANRYLASVGAPGPRSGVGGLRMATNARS